MKSNLRRIARWTGLLLLALIALGAIARMAELYLDARPSGPLAPYLQRATPSAVSVLWRSESPEASAVRYRRAGDREWQSAGSGAARTEHAVRIEGLAPATDYVYLPSSAPGEQEPFRFRTPPDRERTGPVRAWLLGDPGLGGRTAQAVRDAALAWMTAHPVEHRAGPSLILTSGDNAYPSGRDRDFRTGLVQAYAAILAQVPIWPAHGNHDARRSAYRRLFELPTRGEAGGEPSGSERYYAFDHGNVHFIVLDSERRRLPLDGAMGRWLERDLAATDADWIVVVVHRAPHSRGSNDSDAAAGSDWRQRVLREEWMPLLERYGVDLVISGHSHSYERSAPVAGFHGRSDEFGPMHLAKDGDPSTPEVFDRPVRCAAACGTIYLVAGSSAKAQDAPLDHPMMATAEAAAGSVVLDFDGPRLIGRFLRADGTIGDRFEVLKHEVPR